MKKLIPTLLLAIALLTSYTASSFCGFYVAKADAKLFNKTSEVIIARKGMQTKVTMASDYDGPIEEFAIVVPVPVVPGKGDIITIHEKVFRTLDSYSAPRMASYYDQNPCQQQYHQLYSNGIVATTGFTNLAGATYTMADAGSSVKIEARYEVDEYDVLILSSTESAGLEVWLRKNGYKIPENAKEVLEPYIKSGMKFFVAKVSKDRFKGKGTQKLSPIQISYKSEKFMLPIRLGMANANGDQDMVVYIITEKGRVECTNYRTVKIPTDRNVPLFVQNEFGPFYKDVFDRAYDNEDGRVVFLEYAWDVSPRTPVKCDPCVGAPPLNEDFLAAGVFWLNNNSMDNIFLTRLHVRYNRRNFPQDLMFQETNNSERFQGRYVIHYPAGGPFNCEEGKAYLTKLIKRRTGELHELASLTGRDIDQYEDYTLEYKIQLIRQKRADGDFEKGGVWELIFIKWLDKPPVDPTSTPWSQIIFYSCLGLIILLLLLLPALSARRRKRTPVITPGLT